LLVWPAWRAGTFTLQDYSTLLSLKLAQTLPNSRIWANQNEGKLNLPVIFYTKNFSRAQALMLPSLSPYWQQRWLPEKPVGAKLTAQIVRHLKDCLSEKV
jgi:hypothetical protein